MTLKELYTIAGEKKASDIHLKFDQEPIFRIDGKLYHLSEISEYEDKELSESDLEKYTKNILTDEQYKIFLEKKDYDIAYTINDYRFRINFSFERENIAIVARVINEYIPTLDEIGMPKVVKDLLNLPQGFILVTGPTGCGKSTTLASMINYINNNRGANIITLEDPIEYIFNPEKSIISQRQLGMDMNSFSSGLKHVLRQDPDIIMLGEMRDLETISSAVTLAETGHLVLATLHTYNSAQTIDRIIDIFPPHQQSQIRSQLSGVLTAVISQRLLSKKGGGRIAAREILIKNQAIANLIREGKIAQIKSTIETNSSIGMITLDRHIKELYEKGIIEKKTAENQMEDPKMLEK
ncbi:MAG: PilT/PilU family type 4a pilus ATPase [Patescibacteria group bacterium]|jgi:twitching motility protein PilT|nr:PilT/PilU family type 4a pilus ATPase [Patescibacteria group bacterium]